MEIGASFRRAKGLLVVRSFAASRSCFHSSSSLSMTPTRFFSTIASISRLCWLKRARCVAAEVRFKHFEPAGMRKPADVVNALVDNDPGIAGTIVAGNGFKGDRILHKLPPKRGRLVSTRSLRMQISFRTPAVKFCGRPPLHFRRGPRLRR